MVRFTYLGVIVVIIISTINPCRCNFFYIYKTEKRSHVEAANICKNGGGLLANFTMSSPDIQFIANCSYINYENNAYWIADYLHSGDDTPGLCKTLNVTNGGQRAVITLTKCSDTRYYICEKATVDNSASTCELFMEEFVTISHKEDYLLLAGSIIVSVIAVLILLALMKLSKNHKEHIDKNVTIVAMEDGDDYDDDNNNNDYIDDDYDFSDEGDYDEDDDENDDDVEQKTDKRNTKMDNVDYEYSLNDYHTQIARIEMLRLDHLTMVV